jgi:hypothetical protein
MGEGCGYSKRGYSRRGTSPGSRDPRGISDATLAKAIADAERGLIADALGDGLIKLRVARPGAGKRRAYRTIIALRRAHRAFFLHGFAKSDRANIRPDELADLKLAAAGILAFSDQQITERLQSGRLLEVDYE